MYSKQEAGLIRKKFWETAGQYFAPMPSADLQKVNWINYKTGVRFITFRLYADDQTASVAIEISHPDPLKRKSLYDCFLGLKANLGGEWLWEEEGAAATSRISSHIDQVNIYDTTTWPAVISFFKIALVQMDAFWVEFKEVFEMLD